MSSSKSASAGKPGKTATPRLLLVALVVLPLGSLAFWAVRQPEEEVRIRQTGSRSSVSLEELLLLDFNPYYKESTVPLDMATLAALAANVYEPDEEDATCSAEEVGRIPIEGWTQWKDWPAPGSCSEELSDLRYEVWGRSEFGETGFEMAYIAIVFPGTLPTLAHWCSNLRSLEVPMCDPKSDQYLHIAPLVDEILSRIRSWVGPGLDFYTVAIGHSLGGGLAELAGRTSYIDQVFTFDQSPEVATEISARLKQANYDWALYEKIDEEYERFTGCQASRDDYVTGTTIRRIYEHGEILAYLRLLKRGFVPQEAEVIEYRTNLLTGGWVDQHSMKALACALRRHSEKVQFEVGRANRPGVRTIPKSVLQAPVPSLVPSLRRRETAEDM